MRACLSVDEIALYISSAPMFDGLATLEGHVDSCESCRNEIATAVRSGRTSGVDEPGRSAIGRYLVRGVLGSGAMGHVYDAFDPELDRSVALKVIRSDDPQADEVALREGRALARLSHPNIVGIYDVGVSEGRVFIAMERVDGRSVRAWAQTRPPWRNVIRAFIGGARGLAAAHRSGVVHRDIKPDNLVIDADERMRVVDFGLATHGDGDRDSALEAGTPAYMAPEQWDTGVATQASDQYAFVLTVVEAVIGKRPTTSDPTFGLSRGWLRTFARRGLDPTPSRRFPDMAAVAHALERGVTRRRRFALIGSIAGVGVIASAAIALHLQRGDSGVEPCTGSARVAPVWNDQRRATVHMAFVATHKPFAEAAYQRVAHTLDGYTAAWLDMSVASCEATQRSEQSTQLLDLRAGCLGRSLGQADALIGILEKADALVVQHAVEAVQGLPSLATCADTTGLMFTDQQPPPEIRGEVARIAGLQLQVSALRLAGRRRDEIALGNEVLAAARRVDHPPLLARALVEAGLMRSEVDDEPGAEALFRESVSAAERSRADITKAEAEILLASSLGNQRKFADAEQWAHLAEATLGRVGSQPRLEARLAGERGGLAHAQRQIEAAIAHYEKASAAFAKLGVEPPLLEAATIEGNLGRVYELAGKPDRAGQAFDRQVAIVRAAAGPDHPDLAVALANKAIDEINHSRYDAALALYQQAARIDEAALGDSSDLAEILASSGGMLEQLGRFDEARAAKERAYAINLKALGPDNEKTLDVELQLGVARYYQPDPKAALERFGHVVEGYKRLYGGEHPTVAQAETWQALALRELGRDRETLPLLEHALAIEERMFGHDNPMLVSVVEQLGVSYHRLHDRARAITLLERAVALAKAGPEPAYVAKVQKHLDEARR